MKNEKGSLGRSSSAIKGEVVQMPRWDLYEVTVWWEWSSTVGNKGISSCIWKNGAIL